MSKGNHKRRDHVNGNKVGKIASGKSHKFSTLVLYLSNHLLMI